MEMLAEMKTSLTEWIADRQNYLGEINADITITERARAACELMSIVLRSFDRGDGPPASTSGVTPLMTP